MSLHKCFPMNTQRRSMKAFSFSNTSKTEWNQNTNWTRGSITGKKKKDILGIM